MVEPRRRPVCIYITLERYDAGVLNTSRKTRTHAHGGMFPSLCFEAREGPKFVSLLKGTA